jgi:hypothetical protein
VRPYLKKNPSQKRANGMTEGVVLSSNPSTAKKKEREKRLPGFKPMLIHLTTCVSLTKSLSSQGVFSVVPGCELRLALTILLISAS